MDKRIVDLKSYVPDFLKRLNEYNAILDAEQPEFEELVDDTSDMLDDCFMSTAKEEGLIKYEAIMGLVPDPGDSVEIRRRKITAFAMNVAFTLKSLKEKIQILQGGEEVEITQDESDPLLYHIVLGVAYEKLIDVLNSSIRDMLPANIDFTLKSKIEEEPDVYGIEVNFQNNTVTRLAQAVNKSGGSDFDDIAPWGGRYRCNLTDDGVEVAKYGDYAYSETGFLGGIVIKNGITYNTSTPVQVMVKQPKFYYLVVSLATFENLSGVGNRTEKIRYYVSPVPKNGFKLHPLFYDENGNELDYVYLSAYESTYFNKRTGSYELNNTRIVANSKTDVSNMVLASIANALPYHSYYDKTPLFREAAANRGNGWYQSIAKGRFASTMLFMIEYGSVQAQTAIGAGNTTANQAYATGATASLGNASGTALNSDNIQMVSYRGEENLWGNCDTFIDGINPVWELSTTGAYVAYACDDFNFQTEEKAAEKTAYPNYTKIKATIQRLSGRIQTFNYDPDYDWVFIPGVPSVESTVLIDWSRISFSTVNPVDISIGGNYDDSENGMFTFRTSSLGSNKHSTGRLTYIPQNN